MSVRGIYHSPLIPLIDELNFLVDLAISPCFFYNLFAAQNFSVTLKIVQKISKGLQIPVTEQVKFPPCPRCFSELVTMGMDLD